MYFLCHHIRVAKINTCTCIKQEDNKNIFSYRDKFFNSEEKKSNSFNYCKTLKKSFNKLILCSNTFSSHIFKETYLQNSPIHRLYYWRIFFNQSINQFHSSENCFVKTQWYISVKFVGRPPLQGSAAPRRRRHGSVLSIPIRLSA